MDPEDSLKDMVEPVFRALVRGGLSIQAAFNLLHGLAHEGRVWTTELGEVKEEMKMEQDSRKIWDRFNSLEE